jgi:glycine betaine/proline transport system substrate-binding protein
MTAALGDAISNEEPIVVTGWKPHWKFARWDLKILDDPENKVFGAAETINTIVRQGLEEDKPELYNFMSNMDWQSIESNVIGQIMLEVQDGAEPAEAARQVISNNKSAVNSALPEGMSF